MASSVWWSATVWSLTRLRARSRRGGRPILLLLLLLLLLSLLARSRRVLLAHDVTHHLLEALEDGRLRIIASGALISWSAGAVNDAREVHGVAGPSLVLHRMLIKNASSVPGIGCAVAEQALGRWR